MKKIKVILGAMLAFMLLVGCSETKSEYDSTTFNYIEDIKSIQADMSGYTQLNDASHVYRKITIGEANRLFEEDGTAVLYLGYPGCGVCQVVTPILNDLAKEANQTIYYVDVSTNSDEEGMSKFMENTHDYLNDNENGEKALYVPFLLSIVNGEVTGSHIGGLSTAFSNPVSSSQRNQIIDIYNEVLTPFQ